MTFPLPGGWKIVIFRRLALLFLSIFVSVNIDLIVPISERSHSTHPDQRSEQSALAASQLSEIFDQFLIETSCQRFILNLVVRSL